MAEKKNKKLAPPTIITLTLPEQDTEQGRKGAAGRSSLRVAISPTSGSSLTPTWATSLLRSKPDSWRSPRLKPTRQRMLPSPRRQRSLAGRRK